MVFLFDYKSTDYKSWAKGLKKAGYATNPKYPKLLMQVIEENKLHQYDSWKLSDVKKEKGKKPSKPNKVASKPTKSKSSKEVEVIAESKKKPTSKQESKKENTYNKNKYKIEPKITSTSTKQSKVFYSNDIKAVSVKKGDTPKSLAKKHKIDLSKLLTYNELKVNSS